MPNVFSHASPFRSLGLLGGIFHFYSNLKINVCMQTVENLIRRRVLWRLIWFCTVCRCPTKRTLGLYEACIGVLGIQDICHFTSRDIGYYPFYFQGYGILGSIFSLLSGILKS